MPRRAQCWHAQGPSGEARGMAAAKGWAGPLAWDDIDDPQARPVGMGPSAAGDRADVVADLIASGVPLEGICERLALRPSSLHRWAWRTGNVHLWRRIKEAA